MNQIKKKKSMGQEDKKGLRTDLCWGQKPLQAENICKEGNYFN